MRIGILALSLVFLASGAKNIKDARTQSNPGRRLYFGVLMLILGAAIGVYYFTAI